MAESYFYLEILMVAYLGLVFGSFASALVYRIPRDIPWIVSSEKSAEGRNLCRSACPSCHTPLMPLDLVPLFSWLALSGRCRHCKAKIPLVYPLVELSTLAGFLIVYAFAGLSLDVMFLYLLVPFLVSLIFIDAEHYILPDELVGIVGILGLGHWGLQYYSGHILFSEIISHHIGGAVFYAGFAFLLGFVMTKILKREALGFGDVKFFGVAGLWLGLMDFSYFLILSGCIGIVFAVFWRLIKKQDVFPFGPALILSFFILLFIDGSLLG